MTWHGVQQRLLIVRRTYHSCIYKPRLTELDTHNRLLRFKNFDVALINKGILLPKLYLAISGDIGFKFNLRSVLS
ncbi:unnamed protein product [Adineta steineri]|uniref:Autophagy-related protein 9 n=1 Tax=Adineta steineri TaxID=433720 RepID=A0A815U6M4_9BILA|nr:unnamed protein product [Adineta steineri]CAF4192726.1 unnamed protein product [Adineta steineri]